MKVGFKIEIDKNSEHFINIADKHGYRKVERIKPTKSLLLHTYPKEDTIQNGDALGCRDALFMDIHAYDIDRMEYCIFTNKDAVNNFNGIKVNRIYTYKDGSTLIDLKGTFIKIGEYSSLNLEIENIK